MAQVKLMDVVRVLSEEIGPRPTGTEEEQRAATAIQKWLERDAGLSAAIEEVDGEPELDTAQTICFGVAFLATFLAFVVKALALPAIVLTLAAAAVVVLENIGKPVLTRFLRKGISQNVVAVYEPELIPVEGEPAQRGRARKIVLLANYDSARVRAETNGGLARIAVFGNTLETYALLATPIVMLIHYVFFMYNNGVVGTVMSALTVVLLVLLGLRLLKYLARRFAKYNDAANCNATGVAVLVDIAQRVNGSFGGAPLQGTVRHGAAAAKAAGVVPDGANLRYEAPTADGSDGAGVAGAAAVVEGEDDGFAANGMGEDALPGLNSGLSWGTGAAAAAAVGAGAGVVAAKAAGAGASVPEDETPDLSWRGRATATRGYATVDSNLEITSRPFGSAPGSGYEGGYAPSRPSQNLEKSAAPTDGKRTIRAELNDIDYMGDNPRLEAARAAVRAQRLASGTAAESRTLGDTAERQAAANRGAGLSRVAGLGVSGAAVTPAAAPATAGAGEGAFRTAPGYAGFDWAAAAAAAAQPAGQSADADVTGVLGEAADQPDQPAPVEAPKETVIPDWYTRAKASVRRPYDDASVTRSRFNDALKGAESAAAASPVATAFAASAAPFARTGQDADYTAPLRVPASLVNESATEAIAAAPAAPTASAAPVAPAAPAAPAADTASFAAVNAAEAPIATAPTIAAADIPTIEAAPAARPKVTAYALPLEQVTYTYPVARPDVTAPVKGVPMANEPVIREVTRIPAPVVTASPAVTTEMNVPEVAVTPVAPVPSDAPVAVAAPAIQASAVAAVPAASGAAASVPEVRLVAPGFADSTASLAPVVAEAPVAAPAPAADSSAAAAMPASFASAPRFAEAPQPLTGFAGALAVAQSVEERQIAEGKLEPTAPKPVVTLPEIGASTSMKPITMEDMQQRAPLAQAQTSGKDAAKSLLTMLPSINLANPDDAPVASAAPVAAQAPVATPAPAAPAVYGQGGMTGVFAQVGTELSQNADEDIFVDDADDSAFRQNFTPTGAFAGPGYMDMPKSRAKGLLGKLFGGSGSGVATKRHPRETSPQEWLGVSDDFDARTVGAARGGWESFRQDSDYTDEYRGDFCEKVDRLDLPGQREATGYVSDIDAAIADPDAEPTGTYSTYSRRNWNGGAFSLKNLLPTIGNEEEGARGADSGRHAGASSRRRGNRSTDAFGGFDGGQDDFFDDFADEGRGYDDGYGAYSGSYRPFDDDEADYDEAFNNGPDAGFGGYGAFARDGYGRGESAAPAAAAAASAPAAGEEETRKSLGAGDLFPEPEDTPRRPSTMDDFAMPTRVDNEKDLQDIFDFRDANINAEIWFVALGSETPNNSGMKAFLEAHGAELKNALFIELEGLGVGDLCLTTQEGRFRRLNVSTRMRRYVQKAQEALKVKVGSAAYTIDNSATYVAMSHGMQAMHLVGMDGAKPALQHQADDVLDSIDARKLQQNADFVMELVRSI